MMGGLTEAILLVALGIGYVVCYLAKREDKGFRAAGYLIGIFIIVLSASLILTNLFLGLSWSAKMNRMIVPRHKMMMKMQPQPVAPASTPAPVQKK